MRFLIIFLSFFTLHAQNLTLNNSSKKQSIFSKNLDSNLIDSSQLEAYSLRTYRYNTRLDKTHKINIYGIGGNTSSQNLESNYGGVVFSYDGLAGRVPLGVSASYTVQSFSADNDMSYANGEIAHNLQLGFYTDFFVRASQIQIQLSQSVNIPQASSLGIATTTYFNARYGYIFVLNNYGSHLKPFLGANSYFLYNAADKSSNFNVNLDFGLQFVQFITQRFKLFVTPIFRQDVFVMNSDSLMRLIAINLDGNAEFSLPDDKYRSYGILKAGFGFDISKDSHIKLGFEGKIANEITILNSVLSFYKTF